MSAYQLVKETLNDQGFYSRISNHLSKNWDISPEAKALFLYFIYKQKIAPTRDLVKQTGLSGKTINLRKKELAIYGFLRIQGEVKRRNRYDFNHDSAMWGVRNEVLEYEILQKLEYEVPQIRSTAYSKLGVRDTPTEAPHLISKESYIKNKNKEDEISVGGGLALMEGPSPPEDHGYNHIKEFLEQELPLGPSGIVEKGGAINGRKKATKVNEYVFSLSM